MAYIHKLRDWPDFHWDHERLTSLLAEVRHRQGRLLGRMEGLGFELRAEAVLQSLTEEVLKSSEIEDEQLDRGQVRSSLARRLGMDVGGLSRPERNVEGVVEMMLDATQEFDRPLTAERLYGWHAALFPTGRSGINKIRVGKWREDKNGPMQVVSGPLGRTKVHFEAPEAARLNHEMRKFIKWFGAKKSYNDVDPVLKSAIAHFWFVTIHPFDDGNGRIARAIADLALARSENSPQRFYSMSAQICADRKEYYSTLEAAQRGDLDITNWLMWFLECLNRAINGAEAVLGSVLRKARFWELYGARELNERQQKILNRLFDGFEGKLTSSKWATLGKCSQDSATRDINELVELGILTRNPGGGRSTSYRLTDLPTEEGSR